MRTARPLEGPMDSMLEGAMPAPRPAAFSARAAARFAAERTRLMASGSRPTQVRAMAALADLFETLAASQRAREEAERWAAQDALEVPEELGAGRPAGAIIIHRPSRSRA